LNLTHKQKYSVKMVSSSMPICEKPLFDLSSQAEQNITWFYRWSIERIKSLNEYINSNFYDHTDLPYYSDLYQDCMTWYSDEGKAQYSILKQSLTPFFIHRKQMDDFIQSLSRFQERWDDLFQHIEFLEEVEDLYQWLLDLPFLLEKRLRAFGIVSDYHNASHASYGYLFKQRELEATFPKTSLQQACLFLRSLKGCAS
jgi:hypothetical protein